MQSVVFCRECVGNLLFFTGPGRFGAAVVAAGKSLRMLKVGVSMGKMMKAGIRNSVLGACFVGAAALYGCATQPQMPPEPSAPVPEEAAPAAPQELPQAAPPQPQKTAGPLRDGQTEAYMDQVERGLRSLLRPSAIMVMRQADELVVVLPDGRLFSGSALSSDGGEMLHAVARALRYFNHTSVRVNGYTDTRGSFEVNVAKSQRYAALVRDVLIREGVPSSRMQAHGFGPTNLHVPTGDNVREPRNRRVELVIVPDP